MSVYLRLLRVKQWSKNLLVFAALIFSFDPTHLDRFVLTFEAFFAMCFACSATYIYNDIRDAAKDRNHPKKRSRPIAAGLVTVPQARSVAAVCLAVGLGLGWLTGLTGFVIVVTYLAVQVAYNLGLKAQPVADVYTIASGFILRAMLGAAAIHVPISAWLLYCTGALSLMLGFGKRRHEFLLLGDDAGASRDSLVHYTAGALDALVIMFACAAAICYGIYTIESATAAKYPTLIITAPFVFYGITRYVLVVFAGEEGGEPEEMLFRDKHILASILLFLTSAALVLSGLRLNLLER
ncbi:MAG TPA: UbiA family prenyltransferase [Fimbriimonas sp.]|nr:UbiA family prenyltransferase [Fimbriimonas sp.]